MDDLLTVQWGGFQAVEGGTGDFQFHAPDLLKTEEVVRIDGIDDGAAGSEGDFQALRRSDAVEGEGARFILQPAEPLGVPGVIVKDEGMGFDQPLRGIALIVGISDPDALVVLPSFKDGQEDCGIHLHVKTGEDGKAADVRGVEKIDAVAVVVDEKIHRIADLVPEGSGEDIFRDARSDHSRKHFIFPQIRRRDKIPRILEIISVPCPVERQRAAELVLQHLHIPEDGLFDALDGDLLFQGDPFKLLHQRFRVGITVLFQRPGDPSQPLQLRFLYRHKFLSFFLLNC